MRSILITLLVCLIALPVFAEIKNLKVSGHLRFRGYMLNNNTDLADATEDHIDYYVQRTWLGVEGDVADNIFAKIMLENEYVWGKGNGTPATDNQNTINFVYAFAKVKNMFDMPLTLTLGRQDLKLGNGLIVWDQANGFDGMNLAYSTNDFDLNLVNFKINDTKSKTSPTTDADFYGGVGAYKGLANNKFTAYYLVYDDNSNLAYNGNNVPTFLGIRAEGKIIPNLSYIAEYCKEGGEVETDSSATSKDYSGDLLYLQAGYTVKEFYNTTFMLEYLNMSGQDKSNDYTCFGSPVAAPDLPGSPGFDPNIQDAAFLNGTLRYGPVNTAGVSTINIAVQSMPINKLTVGAKYYIMKTAEEYNKVGGGTSDDLGDAYDVYLNYQFNPTTNVKLTYSEFNPSSDVAATTDKASFGGAEFRVNF